MRLEYCCLNCGGQYIKPEEKHKPCPTGCSKSGHVDFCHMCHRLILGSMEAQFATPPKLRLEGGST